MNAMLELAKIAHWKSGFALRLCIFFICASLRADEPSQSSPMAWLHEANNHIGLWVWETNTFDKQTVNFFKPFEIPAGKITNAVIRITVDNGYSLFLDGRELGRGSDWRTVTEYDVTKLLSPGRHVLAASALFFSLWLLTQLLLLGEFVWAVNEPECFALMEFAARLGLSGAVEHEPRQLEHRRHAQRHQRLRHAIFAEQRNRRAAAFLAFANPAGWVLKMRFCVTLILIALFAGFAVRRAAAAPPAGYYQVWADEFNSTSLDTAKWDYWLLGSRRNAVNVTNAVSLNGSNLVITTYTANGTNYTGMVATDLEFLSRFGYWETSIAWGDTNGMWSAMWLQSPTMGTYLNDPFVSGSEIDVAEHRSTDGVSNGDIINVVEPNVHWNGYGSSAQSSGGNNYGSGLGGGFHTYGFLWTPGNYTIYIDGSNVRNWNYSVNSVPVSLSSEWFILSSEVQNNLWSGAIPAGGYGSLATSTTKLTVDYARFYAPTNSIFWTGASSTDLTGSANYITNLPPLATSDVIFSMLAGNNLSPTLGGSLSLDGLVFTPMNNGLTLGGANTLTLGAGGIDMVSCNHSVTLNCPVNIGVAQTWNIGPNSPGNTLTDNGSLSGSATLTKGGYGTVILKGTNSFSGTLNVDTASTTASDGALQIAAGAAIASVASPISIRNNNGGSSTFQLNGAAGGINLAQSFNVNCRASSTTPTIENVAGTNQFSGPLWLNVGGNYFNIQSDAGLLVFSSTNQYVGSLTGGRIYQFTGAGNCLLTGPVLNSTNGAPISLLKSGSGTLTLAATNTYAGSTTVSGGTLGGNGVIAGPVAVQSGGTLMPGNSTGLLTINNTLSLAGTTVIKLNPAVPANDVIRGISTVTLGGTLTVTNLGGTLAGGSSFRFFYATNFTGSFAAVNLPALGGGLIWRTNSLTNGILSVIATAPPAMNFSNTAGVLQLFWPADHLGWTLQMQTNNLNSGLGTNWFSIPNSSADTQFSTALNAANSTVFYRLIYQ